jgi:hypothetical protein
VLELAAIIQGLTGLCTVVGTHDESALRDQAAHYFGIRVGSMKHFHPY